MKLQGNNTLLDPVSLRYIYAPRSCIAKISMELHEIYMLLDPVSLRANGTHPKANLSVSGMQYRPYIKKQKC